MVRRTPKHLIVALFVVTIVGSTVALGAATAGQQTTQATRTTQTTSYVRVLHASPDAPPVDVTVDGRTVLSNVSFGSVSDYLSLAAGTHDVTIAAAGHPDAVVFQGPVTLDPRTVTTLAATGEISPNSSTTFEPVAYDDDAYTPTANESAIRVVHLSPDAPTVDVTTANGSVVLADNVSFRNASDYVAVPAGSYTVEIRAATAGNDGPVVTTVDVSLQGGTAYTALAVGYLDPGSAPANTPFEVVPTTDATATVELPVTMGGTNETPTETTMG